MKAMNLKHLIIISVFILAVITAAAQLPQPGYYKSAQKRTCPLAMKQYASHYHAGRSGVYSKSAQAPANGMADITRHFLFTAESISTKPIPNPNEHIVGTTRYDRQTNGTMQNRILLNDDGTLGTTWTMGFAETAFPDRGTGYNYYDGSSWFPEPSARIENIKTGWPSIARFGTEGEIIVSHNLTSGLEICTRPVKGTGQWTETLFQGPGTCPELSWPRVVTNGTNHQQIHLVTLTSPVANGGTLYNGQDGALLYSRSLDGGLTWDIHHYQFPGTGSDHYVGLGGDTYTWAEPKGDTLALIVGDKWFDLFLLKSNDNGSTWTKTMIWEHPFPFYEENHTIILDTIWVCDGGMAIQLDNDGNANVFFGLMRVNNTDTTDEEFSYWYMTDGIAYWKEGEPMLTCIHADSLYDQGHLVGWMQDLNGNDTIYEELSGIPAYTYSTTGMPTVSIDDNGDIYLVMSSEMEGHNNGLQNYRHILVRKWDHGTAEWGDFFDVTDNIIHNFHECIYPIQASQSDNYIHYIYQADEEPGLAVSGDEDPYGDNYIYYSKIAKSSFVGVKEYSPLVFSVSQNYPNPCQDKTTLTITLNRPEKIQLQLRDLLGRTVMQKEYSFSAAGTYSLLLDVTGLKEGVYVYTLNAGKECRAGKMILQ
jgi:hypothetical protein